jgi:sugar phosphate isomerase/epimerase
MALEGLSINLATVREQWDMRQAVDACLKHGITAIAPWRDQVEKIGLAEAARIVRDNGLRVTDLCRGGMFPASDAAGRQRQIDDNKRAVDEAAALGAACLVLVVGGLPQYSRPGSAPSKDLLAARAQVEEEIAALLEHARSVGMPLALEPLHPMYAADRACVNTLAQALDICDRLDPDRAGGIGVAVDVYHVWWDPALWDGIARAGRNRLLAYHVCDWLVPTRDMLNDRGMMGDGVVDLKRVRAAVEAAGYAGFSEVEIFSEYWWGRPLAEVLDTCIARHKAVV